MELVGISPKLENASPFALSGGQKRRVALAGILAMEPEYLILDEPVAGLDGKGKENLFSLLRYLNEEKRSLYCWSLMTWTMWRPMPVGFS